MIQTDNVYPNTAKIYKNGEFLLLWRKSIFPLFVVDLLLTIFSF
jgi:hypothetical protein